MPPTPAKRSIDSFFSPSTSTSLNKNDATSTPNKRNKLSTDTEAIKSTKKVDKGKGKAKEVETIELDDDEDSIPPQPPLPRPKQEERDDEDEDDDIIIMDDPVPSKASSSKQQSKPSPSKHPIASIFKQQPKPTPSPQKPSTTSTVKQEPDLKPDLKPSISPIKMLSIFDTSSASCSSSLPSAPSTSSSPTQLLDTPLFSFRPSPSHFSPHSRTPFSYLTSALVLLSSTKSRLLIQQVLTNLLRTVVELDPNTLESVVYLLSNRIGPSYEEGTELGVGWQVLSKAIKVS